jgi:CRISPR-associated protein Cmr3
MPTDRSDITWLFVEPQDVLLFRESRPFTAGESSWARSVFPPLSLPFLGALRSKAIVERGVSFDDYGNAVRERDATQDAQTLRDQIGGFDDYGPLRAFGPFPARKDKDADRLDLYFPVPANLADREVREAGGERGDLPVRLTPEETPSWPRIKTNAPHGASKPLHFWTSDEPAGEPERALLLEKPLSNYLEGQKDVFWESDGKLQERERRVGIALGGQRTVREGLLYTVEFIRMIEKNFEANKSDPAKCTGFAIGLRGMECTGLLDAETKLLTLGGESRAASYEEAELSSNATTLLSGRQVVEALEESRRFVLYLATPAVFEKGWRPDFLGDPDDAGEFRHTLGDLSFRLIAASAQKPTPLGGWDLGRGRPRTMYRALPAGAVYVFEADEPLFEEQARRLRDRFHFRPLHPPDADAGTSTDDLNDDLTRLAQAGLGLTLLGASPDR